MAGVPLNDKHPSLLRCSLTQNCKTFHSGTSEKISQIFFLTKKTRLKFTNHFRKILRSKLQRAFSQQTRGRMEQHALKNWEAINRKQITRWQHVSQFKASSFGSR